MKLFIKHMVSGRCKKAVENALNQLGIPFVAIHLGAVDLEVSISPDLRDKLKQLLQHTGLVLMDNKKEIIIQQIKNAVINMIHYANDLPRIKISCYLSENLNYDYTYLSNLFSEKEGITIGQFILHQKIERVKEQICYDELSLTQIADLLHYSSVAHLSNQFKKITGFTPSFYKSMKHSGRVPLENI